MHEYGTISSERGVNVGETWHLLPVSPPFRKFIWIYSTLLINPFLLLLTSTCMQNGSQWKIRGDRKPQVAVTLPDWELSVQVTVFLQIDTGMLHLHSPPRSRLIRPSRSHTHTAAVASLCATLFWNITWRQFSHKYTFISQLKHHVTCVFEQWEWWL